MENQTTCDCGSTALMEFRYLEGGLEGHCPECGQLAEPSQAFAALDSMSKRQRRFPWLKWLFDRREALMLKQGWVKHKSPQDMMAVVRKSKIGYERTQDPHKVTRFTYSQGPMGFLAGQIVKGMQESGFPSKIVYLYRSPEKQAELYAKGRTTKGKIVTRAEPFESAHQYYCAVDIVHSGLGWNVSEAYWEALAAVVQTVAEKYRVDLNHGHTWKYRDSAHIELTDWHSFARRVGYRVPSGRELWEYFGEVLPVQYATYLNRKKIPPYREPVSIS